MSKNFNALCYMRVYSTNKKIIIGDNLWNTIAVRDGSGFNYVTKRIYFNISDLSGAILRLISICRDSYADMINEDDIAEIYIWVDKLEEVSIFNGAEISRSLANEISYLKADLIFSVEEKFPRYDDGDIRFYAD